MYVHSALVGKYLITFYSDGQLTFFFKLPITLTKHIILCFHDKYLLRPFQLSLKVLFTDTQHGFYTKIQVLLIEVCEQSNINNNIIRIASNDREYFKYVSTFCFLLTPKVSTITIIIWLFFFFSSVFSHAFIYLGKYL